MKIIFEYIFPNLHCLPIYYICIIIVVLLLYYICITSHRIIWAVFSTCSAVFAVMLYPHTLKGPKLSHSNPYWFMQLFYDLWLKLFSHNNNHMQHTLKLECRTFIINKCICTSHYKCAQQLQLQTTTLLKNFKLISKF